MNEVVMGKNVMSCSSPNNNDCDYYNMKYPQLTYIIGITIK